MNLEQFKEAIDQIIRRVRIGDEETIRVGVQVTKAGSVGGTPIVTVKSVIKGFDWDNNKVIITTEEPVRLTDAGEIDKLKKEAADIGWSVYEFQNQKREIARLRKRIKELEGHIRSTTVLPDGRE